MRSEEEFKELVYQLGEAVNGEMELLNINIEHMQKVKDIEYYLGITTEEIDRYEAEERRNNFKVIKNT